MAPKVEFPPKQRDPSSNPVHQKKNNFSFIHSRPSIQLSYHDGGRGTPLHERRRNGKDFRPPDLGGPQKDLQEGHQKGLYKGQQED